MGFDLVFHGSHRDLDHPRGMVVRMSKQQLDAVWQHRKIRSTMSIARWTPHALRRFTKTRRQIEQDQRLLNHAMDLWFRSGAMR